MLSGSLKTRFDAFMQELGANMPNTKAKQLAIFDEVVTSLMGLPGSQVNKQILSTHLLQADQALKQPQVEEPQQQQQQPGQQPGQPAPAAAPAAAEGMGQSRVPQQL
jgi:hypothetical protein